MEVTRRHLCEEVMSPTFSCVRDSVTVSWEYAVLPCPFGAYTGLDDTDQLFTGYCVCWHSGSCYDPEPSYLATHGLPSSRRTGL